MSSPQDVAELYKNATTLSWIETSRQVYKWVGIAPVDIDKIRGLPPKGKHATDEKRSTSQLVEDLHHQQLLPGEKLEKLGEGFAAHISNSLTWENIKTNPNVIEASAESVKISLMDLCAKTMVEGTTRTYYGKRIEELAPELLQHYLKFDSTNWKIMYQLPPFLARDMYDAKDSLVTAFTKYFQSPQEQRSDATYFVTALEAQLRALGFNTDQVARVNMLHHWAYVDFRACFRDTKY